MPARDFPPTPDDASPPGASWRVGAPRPATVGVSDQPKEDVTVAQRSRHIIELSHPELYLAPAAYPYAPVVDTGGPGTLLAVYRDHLGNENGCLWIGWTYGVIDLDLEIRDTAPDLTDLDDWETVETGTIDLPPEATLTRTTLSSVRPPEIDHLLSLPTGPHGIAVSARGRDRARADVHIRLQLWPTTADEPVRTRKHDDTFDLRVYSGGRTVIGRHPDPTPAPSTAPRHPPAAGTAPQHEPASDTVPVHDQVSDAAPQRDPVSETPAVPVTGQWERLWRVVMNRCDREVWPSLARTGAGTLAVDRAEAGTGVRWPAELREWFTLHNGGGPADLLPGMTLLSLEQMLELHDLQCAIWCELTAGEPGTTTAGGNAAASSEAGRFVPEFVPIAERDGTMLVCDTRPGPLRGCVTEFGKDTADMAPPGWRSLGALLADLAHSIERSTPFDSNFLPTLTEQGLIWEYSPLG
ncbi:SMI1/KNR4 family protein [Nocardia sp. NPDC056064]|uniref:SMI1/KNR4 family protein n=1 Tax=Nocardia sp. NPDC056064 TaxID=3345701 RepID=UPI0035D77EB4